MNNRHEMSEKLSDVSRLNKSLARPRPNAHPNPHSKSHSTAHRKDLVSALSFISSSADSIYYVFPLEN